MISKNSAAVVNSRPSFGPARSSAGLGGNGPVVNAQTFEIDVALTSRDSGSARSDSAFDSAPERQLDRPALFSKSKKRCTDGLRKSASIKRTRNPS